MTTPADLRALAERVEREEPSRELDTLVWLAVTSGATRQKWSYVHEASGRVCEVDETRDGTRRLVIAPSYTSSLDAAAAALPNGWVLELSIWLGEKPPAYAVDAFHPSDDMSGEIRGLAKGPHAEARARLAAALRARASEMEGRDADSM